MSTDYTAPYPLMDVTRGLAGGVTSDVPGSEPAGSYLSEVNVSGGSTGLQLLPTTIVQATESQTITLSGTLNIGHGGTGATTPATALANLLPAQATAAGKFLQSNGNPGEEAWAAATGSEGLAGAGVAPRLAIWSDVDALGSIVEAEWDDVNKTLKLGTALLPAHIQLLCDPYIGPADAGLKLGPINFTWAVPVLAPILTSFELTDRKGAAAAAAGVFRVKNSDAALPIIGGLYVEAQSDHGQIAGGSHVASVSSDIEATVTSMMGASYVIGNYGAGAKSVTNWVTGCVMALAPGNVAAGVGVLSGGNACMFRSDVRGGGVFQGGGTAKNFTNLYGYYASAPNDGTIGTSYGFFSEAQPDFDFYGTGVARFGTLAVGTDSPGRYTAGVNGTIGGQLIDTGGFDYHLASFGALRECVQPAAGVNATATGTTVTAATAGQFSGVVAGDAIVIFGAGSAGATYISTVASVETTSSITVTATIGTSVTGAVCAIGVDVGALLNTARAALTNGTILVPRGTFISVTKIAMSKDSVSIRGAGRGATTIRSYVADHALQLGTGNTGSPTYNLSVKDLSLYDATITSTGKAAVNIEGASGVRLENLAITARKAYGIRLGDTAPAKTTALIDIRDVVVSTEVAGEVGLQIEWADSLDVRGLNVSCNDVATTRAVAINGGTKINFFGCTFTGFTSYGITMASDANRPVTAVRLRDCEIVANVAASNSIKSTMSLSDIDQIRIESCRITNGTVAVDLQTTSGTENNGRAVIEGCDITAPCPITITDGGVIRIANNNLKASGSYVVHINGADRFRFHGNYVAASAESTGYGLDIQDASASFVVSDNDFTYVGGARMIVNPGGVSASRIISTNAS